MQSPPLHLRHIFEMRHSLNEFVLTEIQAPLDLQGNADLGLVQKRVERPEKKRNHDQNKSSHQSSQSSPPSSSSLSSEKEADEEVEEAEEF